MAALGGVGGLLGRGASIAALALGLIPGGALAAPAVVDLGLISPSGDDVSAVSGAVAINASGATAWQWGKPGGNCCNELAGLYRPPGGPAVGPATLAAPYTFMGSPVVGTVQSGFAAIDDSGTGYSFFVQKTPDKNGNFALQMATSTSAGVWGPTSMLHAPANTNVAQAVGSVNGAGAIAGLVDDATTNTNAHSVIGFTRAAGSSSFSFSSDLASGAVGGPVQLAENAGGQAVGMLKLDELNTLSAFIPVYFNGSSWHTDAPLYEHSTTNADNAAVAIDPSGAAIAVFNGPPSNGQPEQIFISRRSAGLNGTWSTPATITPAGTDESGPVSIAVDSSGNAIASWVENQSINTVQHPTTLKLAIIPAGVTTAAGTTIRSFPDANPGASTVGVDSAGNFTIAYSRFGSVNSVRAAVLPAGSTTVPTSVQVSPSGSSDTFLTIGMVEDSSGDALIYYTSNSGGHSRLFAGGLDVSGPSLSSLTVPSTASAGQPLLFSVHAGPNSLAGLSTVRWDFGDGTTFDGASGSKTYTSPGIHTVTVTATDAKGLTKQLSAQVTVVAPPTVTQQPADRSVCVGAASASFTAAFSGSPIPTIRWQQSTDGGHTFTDIGGATSSTLTIGSPTPAQSGTEYRAVAHNGATPDATSRAATLSVVSGPPVVSQSPSRQTTTAGKPVTFTAAATNAATVRWQVSIDGGKTFADVGGASTETLHVVARTALNGVQYRAVFSNGCGAVSTRAARLTVTAAARRPKLSALKISPARFAPRPSHPQKGKHYGTTISYLDSQVADSVLVIERVKPGVRRGRRCVVRGQGKPCMRYILVGTLTQRDVAGVNRIKFSGRLRGKQLPAGSYRLTVVAVNGARQSSVPLRTTFTVIG